MNMYPQMETPGGTCTPKQKYEWACCSMAQMEASSGNLKRDKDPILELTF